MKAISITAPQLEQAMLGWVQEARSGRTRTHEETDAMPAALVALEQSQSLWERLAAPKRPALDVPQVPGTPYAGGFYAGRLLVAGKLCAIIVAPKAMGDAQGMWGTYGTEIPGAGSYCDGVANTAAMAEAGSPIAQCVRQLDIGGFTDWAVPSRDELELLYRVFKPTPDENTRYSGDNPSALPPTYPYALNAPAQTSVAAFQAGGPEAFEPTWYWSSTQYSAHYAWGQWFAVGSQYYGVKDYEGRVRAVRRLVLE